MIPSISLWSLVTVFDAASLEVTAWSYDCRCHTPLPHLLEVYYSTVTSDLGLLACEQQQQPCVQPEQSLTE